MPYRSSQLKSMNRPYLWVAIFWLKILLAFVLLLAIATASSTEPNKNKKRHKIDGGNITNVSVPVYSRETKKPFDDVIEDLLVIIGEHNFRLNQHAHIGKAIGERNNISFFSADVLHFCNLTYAKELLEVAPDYLLRMPCRLSVIQKNDKKTKIEVWLLPEDDKRTIELSNKINTILKNIVNYGAN